MNPKAATTNWLRPATGKARFPACAAHLKVDYYPAPSSLPRDVRSLFECPSPWLDSYDPMLSCYRHDQKERKIELMDNPSENMCREGCLPTVNRRTFLEVTAGLFTAYPGTAGVGKAGEGRVAIANTKLREFETPLCTLRLDSLNGNLCGITWKDPKLEIIQEPRLGENFRLRLPRPGYEANYFLSSQQKVSRIEERPDGVTCHYDSLRNTREEINVKVRYEIKSVDKNLEFAIDVDNPTDLPLAEVFFGIVGGQHGLGNRQDTESLVPGWNSNLAATVFTNFRAGGYGGGNLGIRYDAAGITYPGAMQMGWMEFFNRKANVGLYYANHDIEPRQSALYFELRPFTKSAEVGENWPTAADVPAGEPIGLTMGWLKFPYLKGGTFNSGPVALQVHQGDWHEGSELYRAWFDQHFQVKRPPTWLRQEMAWQSIIISNCEDVIVWKFKDLPKLAADAKKYGVTTFEILGWDMGGIDRGYPQYRPNPRLGTHEEFRQALAEMKELGVHPLIFANQDMADTATPLFKEKLDRTWSWGDGLRTFRCSVGVKGRSAREWG